MSNQPPMPEWTDAFAGVVDVIYGIGQCLIAKGYFTRPEVAGILDEMLEAQKAQMAKFPDRWSPYRHSCVLGLRDAFAAVAPHASQKAPTVTDEGTLQ